MKNHPFKLVSKLLLLTFLSFTFSLQAQNKASKREFYELKIYNLKDREQEERVDKYLQNAYLPALHRAGISNVGVFKPLGNDTASIRQIYVLTPFTSVDQFVSLPQTLLKDKKYEAAGKEYLDAAHNNPTFNRIESILLQAFSDMPQLKTPKLTSPVKERIYELRSYEAATEKLYRNKVHMFNEGKEISLFNRLGFNPVFFGEVLTGNRMPNLMYMTSFQDQATRDKLWKTFEDDPEWKKLSTKSEYQNNVSKADIIFLHPTNYSDI